jgi:NDP-sugar pyrophosphorylase family protein
MQAIVLAGGLGTRLRSVVTDLPKPIAPVAGRPVLVWIQDRVAQAGLGRVVLAVPATGLRPSSSNTAFPPPFSGTGRSDGSVGPADPT